MLNRRHASGLLAALALLVAAPAAGAETICVNHPGPGCDFSFPAGQLQQGLNEAASATESDLVLIGAGNYTGSFTYSGAPQSDIVLGVGPTTKIRAPQAAVGLVVNAPGVTVGKLKVESSADSAVAVAVSAGRISNAELTAAPGVINARAAELSGEGASLSQVNVTSNADSVGIVTLGAGSRQIEETTVTGASVGVETHGGSIAELRRVRVEGADHSALHAVKGEIRVSDSLLLLGTGDTGLRADDNGDLANGNAGTIEAQRVTVGALPGATNTTGILASTNSTNDQAYMTVRNTVLAGVTRPLRCEEPGGATDVELLWVHRPDAVPSDVAACGSVDQNRVVGAPHFVDAGAADYRLRAASDLIDAAQPSFTSPAGTLGLDGVARNIDGDGDGTARVDVGAFEYGRRQPSVSASAAPAGAPAGAPITFTASGSDPDAGDTLSYRWIFDDGTSATGQTVTHAFASPGEHTATVIATDPADRLAQSETTVSIGPALPDRTSVIDVNGRHPGDPLPPPPPGADTTAPAISALKVTRGPRARFELSERARVALRIDRVVRRRGKRPRFVAAGTLPAFDAKAGANVVTLKRGKKLRAGAYRLTAVARDSAGNTSRPARTSFRLGR